MLIQLVRPSQGRPRKPGTLRPSARRAPRAGASSAACASATVRRLRCHPYRRAAPLMSVPMTISWSHPGSGRSWSPARPRSALPRIHDRLVRSRSGGARQGRRGALPPRRVRRRGMSTSLSEQPEFVAVHSAHLVVIQSHTTDPAISCQGSACGLICCAAKIPATGASTVSRFGTVEVAGQLFDAVDLAAPLDLDGQPIGPARRGTTGRPDRWR